MIIRPATLQDIPFLLALEQASFTSPWTEAHFHYELTKNPYSFTFVALLNDQSLPVAMINFWITFEVAQINNVAVITPLRRKKIGITLIEDAIKRIKDAQCERVTLEVRVSNLAAQKLYHKLGFKSTLTKTHYYDDGEDAYFMELKL
jgi:ribosomal-protein-alanine N-acetyltransferase